MAVKNHAIRRITATRLHQTLRLIRMDRRINRRDREGEEIN